MSEAPNPRGYDGMAGSDSNRILSIISYLLLLIPGVHCLTSVIAVFIAYAKRDEAMGTAYESHFTNVIELFWMIFATYMAMILLFWTVVIFPVAFIVYLLVLYRTVKGLIRASEGRPYF